MLHLSAKLLWSCELKRILISNEGQLSIISIPDSHYCHYHKSDYTDQRCPEHDPVLSHMWSKSEMSVRSGHSYEQ
jgi:hypothetical protein